MDSSPSGNRIEATLTRWGISSAAIGYFGLALNSWGNIIYPANPGERHRILVANPKPGQSKNMWDEATQHLPVSALFHRAALEAHSHLYISNGEKSTMAMWTADIPNVVNTFGEGSRLNDAVRLLQDHNTQHISVIPDCDTHGLRTAQKWQDRATAAGISITLLDLRLYFAEQHNMTPADYHKWDTRDLWLLLGQDKAAFHAVLNALPPLEFDRYADELPSQSSERSSHPKREFKKLSTTDDIDYQTAHEEWWFKHVIPLIEQVAPLPPRGKFRHCPNPNHPDSNPSFRLDEKSGMVFCTCGIHNERKPRRLVASWVGAIPWEDYKKQLREEYKQGQKQQSGTRQTTPGLSESPAAEPLHFERGIPDVLRETMFKLHTLHESYLDHAAAILVYDLWHLGIQQELTLPDQPITIESLKAIATATQHQTTPKTLRRGIVQLVGLGIFVQIADLPSASKGRPTHQYAAQKLSVGLEILRQKINYRLREYAYNDKVPDTVTAEWFPEDTGEIAQALAQYENHEREELYISHAQQRSIAETRYQKAVKKLADELALDSLLAGRSTPLSSVKPIKPEELEPQEEQQALEAEDGQEESLPQQWLLWANGRDYRDHYYREKALHRSRYARNITTHQAAKQVGVAEKTIREMRDRLGIVAEPQYKTIEIHKPEKVLEQIDRAAPWAKGREYGRKVISSSGATINANYENLDTWVAKQLEDSHQVFGRIQIASLERLATPEEIKRRNQDRKVKKFIQKQRRAVREELAQKKKAREAKKLKQMQLFVDEAVEPKEEKPALKRIIYETMPNGFSPDYIEKQLALSKRDPVIIDAIRMGALITFLTPFNDLSNIESGEKGNKSPSDDPDPPPDIGIPPDE